MPNTEEKAGPVALDLYSLEVWGLQGAGYSVKLDGSIDDAWADSFALAQHGRHDASQFYVDRKKRVLVFSIVAGKDLQTCITEVQSLIELTNRRAGRLVPRRPTRPEPPANTEAVKRSQQQRMEDTRGSARVDASLMVEFRSKNDGGADSGSTGMTRDVSETGVFVVTSRLPAVGEKLNLTLHLESRNRLELTGEVMRVLDRNEAFQRRLKVGFGARVTDQSGKYSSHVLGLVSS